MAEPTIPPEALAIAKALDSTARPGTDPQVAFSAHAMNAVEAAAPLIARAARIDEIRAIADWLDAEADRDFLDADSRPYAADRLRERADEMEAPDV